MVVSDYNRAGKNSWKFSLSGHYCPFDVGSQVRFRGCGRKGLTRSSRNVVVCSSCELDRPRSGK